MLFSTVSMLTWRIKFMNGKYTNAVLSYMFCNFSVNLEKDCNEFISMFIIHLDKLICVIHCEIITLSFLCIYTLRSTTFWRFIYIKEFIYFVCIFKNKTLFDLTKTVFCKVTTYSNNTSFVLLHLPSFIHSFLIYSP